VESVYCVCMARINVYVPDELAARSREAGLNVSALTQQAIAAALAVEQTDAWLAMLAPRPATEVAVDDVLAAIDEARDDFGAVG
jgi:post-segregation antitoxin (ccd killing protein)